MKWNYYVDDKIRLFYPISNSLCFSSVSNNSSANVENRTQNLQGFETFGVALCIVDWAGMMNDELRRMFREVVVVSLMYYFHSYNRQCHGPGRTWDLRNTKQEQSLNSDVWFIRPATGNSSVLVKIKTPEILPLFASVWNVSGGRNLKNQTATPPLEATLAKLNAAPFNFVT